ncbi:hypothetical protein BN6_42700 [Saccharothrix espanaensis DSM 44229]|uniref:Uncharacterized protein n=1 Tax=Saccharothrix espanaensis (strain ATCC 51144 / DSM 44229 / JCM 9112 / NBRC 15066 / NRRL 15764) TaxID=1179773 RepID=K0K3Y1_SACES|nr:hypothetical protein BN6_42700 [Saccharothrix espanaensis DSM 44229]
MDVPVPPLPDRVNFWLDRPDLPWARRWDGLTAVVADLSTLVRTGPGSRRVVEQVVELLVAGTARHRAHRAALCELVDRVLDLHAVACGVDPPSPAELADWLLHVQTGFTEPPEVRLAPYAAALGPTGLARYRAEAVARFSTLPVIGFGRTGRYDRERWALLRVVEELAEHVGDVDLQVLVLARDLSSGWHYLQVATVLREAGRTEDALEWVGRGLRATGGRGAAGRLVDLAVDECLRLGWRERAVRWRRRAFLAWPSVETFDRLRALVSGSGGWAALRADVLAQARRDGDPAVVDELLARLSEHDL